MNRTVRRALRAAYSLIIAVVGTTIVLLGLALLLLPGPGMAVVLVGLAVLASECAWARRVLRKAKKNVEDILE